MCDVCVMTLCVRNVFAHTRRTFSFLRHLNEQQSQQLITCGELKDLKVHSGIFVLKVKMLPSEGLKLCLSVFNLNLVFASLVQKRKQ